MGQWYGWKKIKAGCTIAREELIEWVWIDTSCIDKLSSAELSQCINSMFEYYRRAHRCIVLMNDVSSSVIGESNMVEFEASSWWTRAWTLQEFIAPKTLSFYNRDFRKIGDRNERHVARHFPRQAHMERVVFDSGSLRPQSVHCVAEILKWASRRQASRTEDLAYSLLGLLGVNLPLLYGEGKKAFMRLQLEFIRHSRDESIFVWDWLNHGNWTGLLAPSADAFAPSRHEGYIRYRSLEPRHPYSMTNQGLEWKLFLPSSLKSKVDDFVTVLLPLNCVFHESEGGSYHQIAIKIRLTRQSNRTGIDLFLGTRAGSLHFFTCELKSNRVNSTTFEDPEIYGCSAIVGRCPNEEDLVAWEVFFPQSGFEKRQWILTSH